MKVDTLIQILRENMLFSIPPDFHKAQGKILITVGDKEKNNMKNPLKHLCEIIQIARVCY